MGWQIFFVVSVKEFQNPEGWGCDSHRRHRGGCNHRHLRCFRIPKDGGVIPTSYLSVATRKPQVNVSESRRMGV